MADNPTQSENGGLKQEKIKKILRIAGDILLGILLVFAAFVLVVTITAKKTATEVRKCSGINFTSCNRGRWKNASTST